MGDKAQARALHDYITEVTELESCHSPRGISVSVSRLFLPFEGPLWEGGQSYSVLPLPEVDVPCCPRALRPCSWWVLAVLPCRFFLTVRIMLLARPLFDRGKVSRSQQSLWEPEILCPMLPQQGNWTCHQSDRVTGHQCKALMIHVIVL